jgi:hypothetical protein
MTSSIVSSVEKRLLGMMRWAGRSAFSSFALGFVYLAIFSPNGGILSPRAPPNQRNGPSERVSNVCLRPDSDFSRCLLYRRYGRFGVPQRHTRSKCFRPCSSQGEGYHEVPPVFDSFVGIFRVIPTDAPLSENSFETKVLERVRARDFAVLWAAVGPKLERARAVRHGIRAPVQRYPPVNAQPVHY